MKAEDMTEAEVTACSNMIAARLASNPTTAGEFDSIAIHARKLMKWALAKRDAIVESAPRG